MIINGNRDQEIYDKSVNGNGDRNKDLYPVVFEGLKQAGMIEKQAKVIAGAIHGLGNRMDQRFAEVYQRFTTLENSIDKRFTTLENSIDKRFLTLESSIDKRFLTLENSIDKQFAEIRASLNYTFIFMGILASISVIGTFVGFIALLVHYLA